MKIKMNDAMKEKHSAEQKEAKGILIKKVSFINPLETEPIINIGEADN